MFDFVFFSTVIFLLYFTALLLNLDLVPDFPTEYELKRKAREGDNLAKKQAWVKKHASEVDVTYKMLFLLAEGFLIILLGMRLEQIWIIPALNLVSFLLVRFALVKDFLAKSFIFWEKSLVNLMPDMIRLFKYVLKPIYRKSYSDAQKLKSYYSEEEFAYRFDLDSEVLSDSTRQKIERILKSSKTRAKDLMLDIKTIPKLDINLSLTPIIYDELHKKGYDMALAFHGSEENLVGLLYLPGSEAVQQLNRSGLVRVADKMEQTLQYVSEDTKLDELISGFLQGGQNAVLVTGAGGRVSGVITSKQLLAWISAV